MFSRLLIANRGEIACRIMRTCRRLGIQTIAVYSDADVHARHVREADVAVCIGPAPARESYLDAERILRAALATGAEAIHPGYGFLSEKIELIDACVAAGITFIGPHRAAILRMGSKIASKQLALAAGVACVPGYNGEDQNDEHLAREAERLGYPLLIKASAGGGGKGLRRVDNRPEFARQLATARSEARAAFGDDQMLLERCILRARHLEVQLLGDRHGGLVHLFERECSIQRNYQKLIEEAPAHHLADELRSRLFDAALALGRAIAYDSVGTVEFVLDAERGDEPYFLEMNTRLQVEHPVTEMTTGLDLVECQIRSALGESLPFAQGDIRRHGWAIEARVNAEVPDQDYRGSFGVLRDYAEPQASGLRVDSGIDGASEVTPHYDSMLAKVIAFGGTRDVAVARLRRAVREFYIDGVQTNQTLLDEILGLPAFDEILTTRFLPDAFPSGWQVSTTLAGERLGAAAAAWYFAECEALRSSRPLDALCGFRLTTPAGRAATCMLQVADLDTQHEVVLSCAQPEAVDCRIGNETYRYQFDADARALMSNGHRYVSRRRGNDIDLWCEGHSCSWTVLSALQAHRASASSGAPVDEVRAELPGIVTQLLVQTGQTVTMGMPLAVLEAMKLVHSLCAPRDGVIASIGVSVGDIIQGGTVLVTLEPVTG